MSERSVSYTFAYVLFMIEIVKTTETIENIETVTPRAGVSWDVFHGVTQSSSINTLISNDSITEAQDGI